jgi:hypothetical protein
MVARLVKLSVGGTNIYIPTLKWTELLGDDISW